MKEALWYEKLKDGGVHCHLCPYNCIIADDKVGVCAVRKNINGILYSLIYNKTTSVALDPIEKKPLYHYHPGEFILSLGTSGCNFHCDFCQNWEISQVPDVPSRDITAEEVVQKAKAACSFGVAYTYNEPFIWYEFVLECSRLAKKNGLENVLITNGYVNLEPLEELLPFIDAMNIDIKSMDEEFYRKLCKGRLAPVLEAARRAHRSCHIEITNLVIPTLNDRDDNFQMLRDWIFENLGQDTPLHFSRYFPCYKMKEPPTTPVETLKRAYEIAKKKLKYVYIGNV